MPSSSLSFKSEHADAASALAKALRARALKSDDGVATATQNAVENLTGLIAALVLPRPAEGEGESGLEGALLAVEHVNRLAWRYFVQNLPYQGDSVMQKVYLCTANKCCACTTRMLEFDSSLVCGSLGVWGRLCIGMHEAEIGRLAMAGDARYAARFSMAGYMNVSVIG